MSAGLVCPHCGHVNTRAGVFCAKCGGKVGAAAVHGNAKRATGGKSKAVINWMLSLLLLGIVGMMFWPQHVPEVRAHADTGRAVAERIARLRHAAQSDTPAAEVFRQEEVNTYLAWLRDQSPAPGRFTATLDRLFVTFDEQECTLRILSRLGPLRISFALKARILTEEDQGRFETTGAAIGHLPIPRPLVPWVARKMMHVVADMEDERMVFSRMRRVESREGRLGIAVGTPR